MISPQFPENEVARLARLQELHLLDTSREPAFDQLVELAAQLLRVPMALISLVDKDRQWFKASIGIGRCEIGRDISFCGHMMVSDELLVVNDALQDPRFADNPLVTGEPGIRAYAGCPLSLEPGEILGSFCVADTQPRCFSAAELRQLKLLASQATELLRMTQQQRLLSEQDRISSHRLARYEAITKGAAAGIVRIDGGGLIREINDYALTLLGYRRDELLGKNVSCLMPEQWSVHHDHYLRNYIDSGEAKVIGKGRKVAALHKDGRQVPVHLAVGQVMDPHHPGRMEFIGILTDLTEMHQAEQREREERALLRSIIDASRDPIFARSLEGEYLIANQASHDVIQAHGADVRELRAEHFFGEELMRQARECDRRVMATGQSESLLLSLSPKVRFDVTKSPLKDAEGQIRGVVSVAHNVSELWQATSLLEKQQQLLSVLHRGLTDYSALMSGNRLWPFLQEALRELTGSDYSLIGEVLPTNGQPALKIHAISDLSWNEESRQLMHRLQEGNMLLTNPDSMLGQCFAQGNIVLSNRMGEDERRGGFPPGHPPLHNYLGVPILDDGTVIGMYAIANGREDYDDELVAWLEPFTSTCALLINLYRQLNEREQFTEQLRQARDEAERASRAKSEFLSSMSHELRTPLNAIMGFAQLLQSNRRTPLNERQQRQVEQIYKSGTHLLNLINEVLDLARIEAGRINMSLESILLKEVIDDACDTLAPIAQQQGLDLEITSSVADAPAVSADYTRLKQVLINLISNAIKYNRPRGRVEIGCRREPDALRVLVRDTGFGIDPQYLEQLFQPFNRLGAENGTIEGTGVGLALTKSIVEQMGGSIGLENHPGDGCEFWFSLPLAAPSLKGKAAEELTEQAGPEPVEGQPCSVLYVEDNPANQRLMLEVFEERKWIHLDCVHSAELAFEMACSTPPDLILMDINLPGMSGFDAVRLLARHPQTCAIPVVALSANAMPEDIKNAMRAGFRDYLTKPIDIPRLLALLDSLQESPH
ncbi:GAF domain-containing protein [Oceanisphaera psychrotolerans]|uniref:GAF domain-containing protein n=1 Tax=Oceanisphaera psychrotolerans TaxID=1414654 RepID=UPI000B0B2797|nr:GAF domain-containing protein [Oceanisphaera psychrotolerans]